MVVKYFSIPFASSGDLITVPDATQPDGSISYTQGYPIGYSTPVGSGGINIERAKMNQVFNDVTTALQQYQQVGFPPYFASLGASPGYAKFACVLYSDGVVYQSQINANTDTPGATANWVAFPLGNFSGFSTGDAKVTFKTSADTGWILANDGTIGNAASGGTTRANADTLALFTLLWNNISNTYCAVSGGRGASAAADFAANKNLAIPKTLGRALAVAGSGASLTARSLGQTLGEELHVLITAELAAHNHPATFTANAHSHGLLGDTGGGSGSSIGGLGNVSIVDIAGSTNLGGGATSYFTNAPVGGGQYVQNTTETGTVTTTNTGSGTGHNNMQPSVFTNFMIKL